MNLFDETLSAGIVLVVGKNLHIFHTKEVSVNNTHHVIAVVRSKVFQPRVHIEYPFIYQHLILSETI